MVSPASSANCRKSIPSRSDDSTTASSIVRSTRAVSTSSKVPLLSVSALMKSSFNQPRVSGSRPSSRLPLPLRNGPNPETPLRNSSALTAVSPSVSRFSKNNAPVSSAPAAPKAARTIVAARAGRSARRTPVTRACALRLPAVSARNASERPWAGRVSRSPTEPYNEAAVSKSNPLSQSGRKEAVIFAGESLAAARGWPRGDARIYAQARE
mmetsp:Transcript_14485/g.41632  ORF Transcript_14485/g.41632 Transcript_14485/m.41632 type:complete len:211 (+) Transcript_14485:255-887(+)